MLLLGLQVGGTDRGTRLYRDRENGFCLQIPQDWSIRKHPQQDSLIKADLVSPDRLSGIQIRIYDPHFRSFNQFITWYTRRFLSDMPAVEPLGTEFREIAGLWTCELSFDARKRNGYFLKSTLVHTQNRIFVFQCGTPFSHRDIQTDVLDSIIDSFRLDHQSPWP